MSEAGRVGGTAAGAGATAVDWEERDEARCGRLRFAEVLGLGRAAGVGEDASSGSGASGRSSSAGMTKPKSISPTLCLLSRGQLGVFGVGCGKALPCPAHAVAHALVSCAASWVNLWELCRRGVAVYVLVAIVSCQGASKIVTSPCGVGLILELQPL